ncbi:MAG TPA: SDR family oxidoreductase [Anaerolineaceae bacterium]|nr:SDR family oxidoreductase [Anaerolineaceae bacterium]
MAAFETHEKSVLITGSSRGLGLALSRRLAGLDWNLIVDARGAEELNRAFEGVPIQGRLAVIPGDISNPQHRQDLAQAAADFGGLDALVNNAGILGASPLPALLDFPLDRLEEIFRINVVAQLGLIQALRPHFKPGARILNITSDAAINPYEGWGGYGAAKAAFEQASAVLALEAPDLRVYVVDPGDMRTRMHQEAYPGEDINDRPLPEESVPGLVALLEGDLPGGRYVAKEVVSSE